MRERLKKQRKQGEVKRKLKSELRAWSGDCDQDIKSPGELQNSQMAYTHSLMGNMEHTNTMTEV